MSANVNLDTVLNPFVILTNVGINSLTQAYYSRLNPKWDTARKTSSAVTFHYNVKVTLHNAAVGYLIVQFAKSFFGKGSFRSLATKTIMMLFIKTVLAKTLSIQGSALNVVKGVFSQLTGNESLEGVSISDNAYSSICVTASKAQSLARDLNWKEDFLAIQGYPVLKNWAPIAKI